MMLLHTIKHRLKGDYIIWTVVLLLAMISLLVVYSAVSARAFRQTAGNTEVFLIRHAGYLLLALGGMWVTHNIDYKYFSVISKFLLILSAILLVFTFFKGISTNEASRWVRVPLIGITFQTSDLAKLALIAYLASFLAKKQKHIDDVKSTLFPVFMWSGGICLLIALSDLSTACVLMVTCLLVMFIGRVTFKHLFSLVGICVLGITLALMIGSRGETALNRVKDWWAIIGGDVAAGEVEVPYQVAHANMAIANGGLLGQGVGNSQQRYFLPEAYADYIYAIIVEEGGLVLALVVLLLYIVLLYRGMVVLSNSKEPFGGLLATGLSFSLVIQALVNMAVVVGIGPVTGLPLPMISMGGTSLLFTGVTIGIVLSVSRGSQVGKIKDNQ